MIRRDEIESGRWYAVPVLAPATGGAIRAEVAFLRVSEVTFREVVYREFRGDKVAHGRCSPETFQSRVGDEGFACGRHEIPSSVLRLAGSKAGGSAA